MDAPRRVALMWAAPPDPAGSWWVPGPGTLVTDTAGRRIGTVIAWDDDTRTVTLVSPNGGETWETSEFHPANRTDITRAPIKGQG